MRALGRPQDMFSDKAIQLQPIFAQWIQNIHLLAPGTTAPNALATTSYAFGGDVIEVGGKIAMMPIKLGTADFMVHHIHAFTIHVTVLILLKKRITGHLLLDVFVLFYFIYRALLTFSRGGMLTAGVAFTAFIGCIVLHKRLTFKKLFLYTSVSFALFIGVWLYTTNITGGLILNRYAGKNAKGVQKKDASAGRGAIFEGQLESFYESPFFGIGVGNGKYKRIESNLKVTAAAHNEISRLLEEQGLLGFIALLILLIKPLVNIYFGTMYQRSFLISFYLFWFLTINHSAMRLAFPAFVYGLSLIKIKTEHE